MVFQTPELSDDERLVLRMIADLREELKDQVAEPRRWGGTLRKMAFARAVQGSNSIEGYNASLDDVVATVEGEPTLDASQETQLALAGYRDAMTYVLQIAGDEALQIGHRFGVALQEAQQRRASDQEQPRRRHGAHRRRRRRAARQRQLAHQRPGRDRCHMRAAALDMAQPAQHHRHFGHGLPLHRQHQTVRRIDELKPGGGFVIASIHNMQAQVPVENILAFWDAVEEAGSYD